RASRLRAAGRRQGEQDDRRPGTQADSMTASSMLHIASIPPIEGALPLVIGWSQVPARLRLAFVCDFGRHSTRNRRHIAGSARTQMDATGASAVPGLLWGAAGKGERRDPGDRGDRTGGLPPDGTAGGRGRGGDRDGPGGGAGY